MGFILERCRADMHPSPDIPTLPNLSGSPIGYASNGGVRRYLLEAESTTGFVAWKLADGTTLVSNTTETSIAASPSLSFWPCASYTDTTPAGQITFFACHGNLLAHLDVTALTGLEYLDCSFNRLVELPLAGLTELQCLDAESNLLASLDVRHLAALRVLYCASNRLIKLDLSGLANLQILDCSNNRIASLSLDGCTALQDAETGGNPAVPRTCRT
jgi:Leucine-rich repeat (LRR) protein